MVEQQVPQERLDLLVRLEFKAVLDLLELLEPKEVQGSQETEGRLDPLVPQVHKDKLAHLAVRDYQD